MAAPFLLGCPFAFGRSVYLGFVSGAKLLYDRRDGAQRPAWCWLGFKGNTEGASPTVAVPATVSGEPVTTDHWARPGKV